MRRSLQVKLVKDPKMPENVPQEETTLVDQFITTDAAKALVLEGMKLVAFWVALDTARKAVLIIAAK